MIKLDFLLQNSCILSCQDFPLLPRVLSMLDVKVLSMLDVKVLSMLDVTVFKIQA